MKSILILFSLIILSSQFSILNSTLWEIKQDGTGDYNTITEGIDAAQSGDTLLVYPGIYYENINYSGKDIVITSLYRVTSDDRRYIRETIIDGSQNGTVVTFSSRETRDAVLSGFTIRNGEGVYAGGIEVRVFCSPIIRYCIVENNHATWGAGGICVHYNESNPLLRGNVIRYNTGGRFGGVIFSGGLDSEFCSEEPNSIYLNYGSRVGDLHISVISQATVIIDTLTVQYPDRYFVRYGGIGVPRDFNVIVNHSVVEPIENDLYVSPDGCDSNSGLTPEEPLQRISTAMIRIQPDPEQQRTIYLAEGIYSRSLNDQSFPVGTRNYIDIVGADKETTILDGEDIYILLDSVKLPTNNPPGGYRNFTVKNLTLTNAHRGEQIFGAISFRGNNDFTLENLNIMNTTTSENSHTHQHVRFDDCDNFILRNINIENNDISPNIDGTGRLFTVGSHWEINMYGENIRINNNHSSRRCSIIFTGFRGDDYNLTFANFEMTDNLNRSEYHHGLAAPILITGNVRLINATIAGNIWQNVNHSLAIRFYDIRTKLSIYNSIIYDNGRGDYQIYTGIPNPNTLNVSYSLIEGGIGGINNWHNNYVNWGEGNIDDNPRFIGENDLGLSPYSLSERSPARGAGTLDIPDLVGTHFEFPEYDLAGNPRIVDGKIDMGAYQWQPPPTSVEEGDGVAERLRDGEFNLRNFPNPVTYLHSERQAGQTRSSTGTTIAFEAPESGEVVVEIYNVKGQFVRRVFDAYITKGEYNVFWDGKDERGRYVATGFYMYNLHFNDELVATGRATFIK